MTQVPLIRRRLTFQAERPVYLPEYPGSTWRGALGRGLKRLACITGHQDCDPCAQKPACDYARIFEPQAFSSASTQPSGYRDKPRPYVLHLPWRSPAQIPAGSYTTLEYSLFGPAVGAADLLLQAFELAAKTGLGQSQAPLRLHHVEQRPIPDTTPPPPEHPIQLHLTTPLRLKHRGRFVDPQHFSLIPLAQALNLRVSQLLPQILLDPKAALNEAHATRIVSYELQWQDWQRYSNRQRTLMKLGGLLGHVTLPAPATHFPNLWSLLWWGQHIHAGKSAVMGLGGYGIERKKTEDM